MSWLFSQALVVEYLGENFSDGEQSAPLSGKPIQLAYCAPDKMTDFSRLSRFGMMFKPLTESRGEELLMSYLEGFHARTLAQQDEAQELKESGQECGEKWLASFVKFDPDTHSWRTHQCSLLGDLELFSETWPQWGFLAAGAFLEPLTLEQTIKEIVYGLLEGELDEQNVEANKTGSDLIVSVLRSEDGKKASVLWTIDGFGFFLEKEILLKDLSKCIFSKERGNSGNLQASSQKVSERLLRTLLLAKEIASSSQGQKHIQQLCGEFADIVCELSQHIALAGENQSWKVKMTAECWEQRMLEQTIRGTGFGLSPDGEETFHTPNTTGLDGGSNSRKALKKRQVSWPTPTCHMSNEKGSPSEFKRDSPELGTVVLWFPTPQASDNRDRGNLSSLSVQRRIQIGKQISLSQSVDRSSGQLNPTWVEWLMGWPQEWTDLKPLAMDKSPCVQQQPSES